ncbi:hypothetical protein BB31_10605 [Amycolatopsis lurida NRRL 2430]|uniref:Uncharacterized protein n=1 Tax=Amycolatopsis lurida NRRL 2430 TaxID=1460371 RepID=A0A2P2FX71_AMYLU|nr:hypothetical protein BB31_10605 [Amycolatopsis lurida NRRL 2430]
MYRDSFTKPDFEEWNDLCFVGRGRISRVDAPNARDVRVLAALSGGERGSLARSSVAVVAVEPTLASVSLLFASCSARY